MSTVNISELNKSTKGRSVIVRVLKVWATKDYQRKDNGLEAIVMDAEGSIITVFGLKNAFKHLKSIKEGETIRIVDFTVEENGPPKFNKTRVAHEFKINVLFRSKILAVKPDASITMSSIRLFPFESLKTHDAAFFVDVIGRLVKKGDISTTEKGIRRMEIEIVDERGIKLKMTLWEGYADRINAALENKNIADGVTILLQFGQKYMWDHEIRVQSTMHASVLYIDDEIPEIIEFNNKKRENGEASSSITMFSNEMRVLNDNDWLNKERIKTPKWIDQCTTGGSYILFLNFEDLDQEADWFYNACSRCTAGVKDRNPGDSCIGSKCKGQPIENVVPRLKVIVDAKNSDEEKIKLVLFETIIVQLTGLDTTALIESATATGDVRFAPDELTSILGKDYLCQVQVNKGYNVARGKKDFTVEAITDSRELIDKFLDLTLGTDCEPKLKEEESKDVTESIEEDASTLSFGKTPNRRRLRYGSDEDEANFDAKFDESSTKAQKTAE